MQTWKYRAVAGQLFEISSKSGDILLRMRGGMMPTESDARLMVAAPRLLAALKTVQSRLCEHCPQYADAVGEQVGDHTDECLEAMETIEAIEGK